MDVQKKDFPQLRLPILFMRFREAIEKLDGYNTEGIFRISPSKKEMEDYIEKVKVGDFSINFRDPHIPSGSLKQWLREMDSPLIPSQFYAECLRISELEEEKMIGEINKIVELIPLANRALIHALTDMSRTISSPPYVDVNRMSITNLAIVFAPSFLRPVASQEEKVDLISGAMNNRGEVAFTATLLANLPIDETLIHKNFDFRMISGAAITTTSRRGK
jgi:hypothetical protein